jgi:flagellar M-ring protein FliF
MDFLNKYFAQIRELFEGMTPGARVTSALLLAVTIASLGYLFTSGFTPGGDVFLLDNRAFSSDELTAMEGAFATEGLGDYEIVGGRIRVPRGKSTAYVAALAKAGVLPADFSSILDNALNKSGTFEDKSKFQARLRHGKQQFLAEVFRNMKGIERAAVLFDEEVKGGLRRERVVTASVSVKPIGGLALDDSQVRSICQTMVGAVAGLHSEKVVVMDLNTGKAHHGSPSDSPGAGGESMEKKQRQEEDYYRRKIEDLLALVPGVIVTPTVELTPEKIYRTESTEYDKDKSVSVSMSETKTSKDYTGESKGGRPGYVAQQNTARSLPTTESKGAKENEKTSEMVESKLPAGERVEKEYAAHMIDRVSVAIAVPTSWFTKIWQKRNPTPPGEDPQDPAAGDIDQIRTTEIDRIKKIVAGAIPPPKTVGGGQIADLVQVTDFEDIIPAAIPEPTMTENAGSWFAENWSTVGLILLGLFSLLMLRSMIRSTPSGRDLEVAGVEHVPSEGDESEDVEGTAEPRVLGFSESGASLQDDLTELVATDPETAANILKNWIGAGVGAS